MRRGGGAPVGSVDARGLLPRRRASRPIGRREERMDPRSGLRPPPERVREILLAGSKFIASLFKWNPHLAGSQNVATLPGFPALFGVRMIVESAHQFERALNPESR